MMVSFGHRISGVGLYIGALVAAGWAIALAGGPSTYAEFKAALGSLPGKVLMFGLTVSLYYHLGTGLRHLVFDAGYGLSVKHANFSAVMVLVFTGAATLLTWVAAFVIGAA